MPWARVCWAFSPFQPYSSKNSLSVSGKSFLSVSRKSFLSVSGKKLFLSVSGKLSVCVRETFLSVSEKKPWAGSRRLFYFFVRKMIWKRLGTRIESEQSRPTTIRRSEPWKKSMSWPSAIPGRSLNIR